MDDKTREKRQSMEELMADELKDVFSDLDTIITSTAGPSAHTMTSKTSQKDEGECEHTNFDSDDVYGYYCDDCGAIGIDMPTSESSKKKKGCDHRNYEFSDEAGIFCPDCGKVWRDTESCYVAEVEKVPEAHAERASKRRLDCAIEAQPAGH